MNKREEKTDGKLIPGALVVVLGVVIIVFAQRIYYGFIVPNSTSPLETAWGTTVQQDDMFGTLNVTYPSHLRSLSSERIDVRLNVPPKFLLIPPTSLERLPSPITPTLGNLTNYQTNVIISQQVAAVLTSSTFLIEPVYPTQQSVSLEAEDTTWSWIITAPETPSSGLLTLKIFKLYEEDSDLTDGLPSWVGTIPVEVFQSTPSPSPTATAPPPPTATPGRVSRAIDNIADNSVSIVVGLLSLIGVIIAAYKGPVWVERWKQGQKVKLGSGQSIANMLHDAAIREINKADDIILLKAWLLDENQDKNRKTIVKAIEERIKALDSAH
jgi:hypothetical protein